MTKPAPPHRLISVAWVIALANSKNRIQAVAAMAWSLFMVVTYALRRAVYESDDKDGVVFFGRHRPVLDVMLVIPLGLGTMFLLDRASRGYLLELPLPVLLAVVAFLGYGMAGFLSGSGSLSTITGPETPPGDRYAMMALAQRPGTWMSAISLARRLVRGLPEGCVVVAAAADERLAERYERLGFTRGEGLRVYLVTGEHE